MQDTYVDTWVDLDCIIFFDFDVDVDVDVDLDVDVLIDFS